MRVFQSWMQLHNGTVVIRQKRKENLREDLPRPNELLSSRDRPLTGSSPFPRLFPTKPPFLGYSNI
jgi:hypothetical protein